MANPVVSITARRVALAALVLALMVAIPVGVLLTLQRVPLVTGIGGCRTLADQEARTDCVSRRTIDAARADGVVPALAAVQRAARSDGRIDQVCHVAMHAVARAVTRSVEADLRAAMGIQGDCVAGFAHGSVEQAARKASATQLAATAKLCDEAGSWQETELSNPTGQCYHGLGHGLRRRFDDGTAAVDNRAALELCESSARSEEARYHCYSGAFMEDQWVRTDSIERTRDVVTPCDAMRSGIAATSCWSMVPGKARLLDMTMRDTGAQCARAARPGERMACEQTAGSMVVPGAEASCLDMADPDGVRACFTGFLRMGLAGGDLSPAQAASACAALARDGAQRCSEALGASVRAEHGRASATRTCRSLPERGATLACVGWIDRLPRVGARAALVDTSGVT